MRKINEKLKTGHKKIIKAGETVGLGIGFTVFEFAKKYLIIKRQPGSSKNMQRNKIKEIIEEAERKMQSNNKIIEELLCINIIEEWWKDTQKERNELYEEKYKEIFDKILLDVPCLGLGVLKRKPDIKWQRKEEDINEITKIQKEILNSCSKYLKENGGEMIYNDKSSPDDIKRQFKTSKNYFKMALGGLMKKGLIAQDAEGCRLL